VLQALPSERGSNLCGLGRVRSEPPQRCGQDTGPVPQPHFLTLFPAGIREHIRNPDVGDLEFVYEAVNLPDYPGWTMFAYTSAAGSATEERIQLLGSLASTPSETPASAAPGN
jgi:hypothetical protein